MADPLSIASGIAGLLSLAGAAFHGVHQYVRTVKDAKDFVKALSKELQSLSSVLQGVKVLAEAFEQDGTAPSVGLGLEHISSCRTVLDEILKETKKIREAINSQKSITSKVEYVKWPFRKSKTEDLINQLSRHKATLTLALDAASLSALADCLGKVNESGEKLGKIYEGVENLQVLKQIHLDAQRKDVLDFFMPVDPSPNLQTSWKLRHPGTGIWLTESLRFRTWISEADSKIWLSGIPGAGKTVLAGAVIREALQQAATGSKVGVAFFFCDYKNPATWDITNILGAIATQLAWQNESAFAKLKDYHDKIKPRLGTQLRPDSEDLHEVISEGSEAFAKVFLVIDGLDECGDNAETVSNALLDLTQDIPNLSSAFFSRDEAGIRDILQDHFDQVSIAAHSEDISLYVGAELEKRVEKGHLRIFDTTLKDEILSRLTSGAQGMFRWVACQLDALGECVTDADRRAALYELPKTLPQTYERILGRVNQKRHSVQRLVRLTLHFLALQNRLFRLSAAQLCLAVSIPEQWGKQWDDSLLVTEQEITRACSSFLRKSADGQYFEFAHFSVREYLQDPALLERSDLRPYHVSEGDINDTVACQFLRFLHLKNFDRKPCRDLRDGSEYWPDLVFSIQEGSLQPSSELLDLQKALLHPRKSNLYLNWAIEFCSSPRVSGEGIDHSFRLVLDSGLSTLHIAAALNLQQVGVWLLQSFAQSDSRARVDKFDRSILWRHAENAQLSTFTDSLSTPGETLSSPSQAFKERRLMRISCEYAAWGIFPPLRSLLMNGWELCSEDISIATQCLSEITYVSHNQTEPQFYDFVKDLNTLGIHETEEGHKFCELIWGMAIRCGQSFTDDTSLLPSDITLSDVALVETAVRAIQYDDLESLTTCEKDSRFKLHEFVDKYGHCSLHIAARHAAYEILNHMIDTGCDVQRSDSKGENLLHVWVRGFEIGDFNVKHAEKLRAMLGDTFNQLLCSVNYQGQTPLGLALQDKDYDEVALWLLKYYPSQLGCCHGMECIWKQAAEEQSSELAQILKDNNFPVHPDYTDGRPFHSLHPYTTMEKFDLLRALYPDSLKCRKNGKLVLESYLSRWTGRGSSTSWDAEKTDVELIRTLLHNSETLPPTSREAIDFCCQIVSDFSRSEFGQRAIIIQLLLDHGIDAHPGPGSKSILETACQSFKTRSICNRDSAIDILTIILDRVNKKKLNMFNEAGYSILHVVCTAPDIDVDWLIPEIIRRGADINLFSKKDLRSTPLVASLSVNSGKAAQNLLRLGRKYKRRHSLSAGLVGSCDQNFESIRLETDFLRDHKDCFDFFVDNSLIKDIHSLSADGFGCLHFAALYDNVQMIDYLLDLGLDINQTAADGSTPLHMAVRREGQLSAEILLRRGSLIKKDMIGMTPMMYARQQGYDDIIELLAEYEMLHTEAQASIVFTQDARNKYWRKALASAIFRKDVDECSRLLQEGCSVNVSLPVCGGCSPLLMAIQQSSPDHCETVKFFLDNSASVCKTACTKHGSKSSLSNALRRPYLNPFLTRMLELCLREGSDCIFDGVLVESVKFGNIDAVGIILKHACDNEAGYVRLCGSCPSQVTSRLLNNYGADMPLHWAVVKSNLKIVKQLVQAGADVNGQDDENTTPLQYCQRPGGIAVAEYLLTVGATPTLPPSITWVHHLDNSAASQKSLASQILRLAPNESIYGSLPTKPELYPNVLFAVMNSGQDLNAKDESSCSIMLVAMGTPETANFILNSAIYLTSTGPYSWSMLKGPIEDTPWLNRFWDHYRRRFGLDELSRISNLHPKRGWSPLCLSTCTDAIGVMRNCLEMGAQIDFEGSPYGSALMAAAGMNRIESVKFLVRQKASIFYEGRQGFTSAVAIGASSHRVVQWLLVGRFQEQGKLEASPELGESTAETFPTGPHRSWFPTSIHLRLCGKFERQPHESSLAYLTRLASIKREMRGKVVPLPKPEFLATSVVTAIYDI
ncbi:hypothetical protein G7054_g7020 [Neopestalotiopsis clavispora]|nr:hypothetical protein G7054_g7020 [Neopestalotiopsis clavispora]